MDSLASLSCFLSSTEDGLPEKKRSISDNEKMHEKQSNAFLSDFMPLLRMGDVTVRDTRNKKM
jgi:hypothetical protein